MTKKEVINELELKYAAEHEEYKKQYDSYHSGAMAAIDEAIQIVEKLDDTEQKWIPVSERLPENAKHKGAFCPKYQVMTTWGQTVGWYNPDFESWYIVLWFMTGRCLTEEIDFERADIPRVVKVNKNSGIVLAWMHLPEPYKAGEQE